MWRNMTRVVPPPHPTIEYLGRFGTIVISGFSILHLQTDNQLAKHCTDELSPSNPERVDAAQGVWSLHKMGGNAHCKMVFLAQLTGVLRCLGR